MGFLAGIAEAFEQIAHSALRIRHVKLLFDPGADLFGALKAVRIELGAERNELFFAQKAVGTAGFQRTQGVQAAAIVKVESVGDRFRDNQKELRDFAVGMALVFEQETLEGVRENGRSFLVYSGR